MPEPQDVIDARKNKDDKKLYFTFKTIHAILKL